MCNCPDCPGGDETRGKFECRKCEKASKIKWFDPRKSVRILKTKKIGDMVFTEGEEWFADKDLVELLIKNELIAAD